VDAGSREEPAGMRTGELDSFGGSFDVRPGHHHLHYTGVLRTRYDRVPIAVVAVVTEIDADVYERERGRRGRGCGMVFCHVPAAFY